MPRTMPPFEQQPNIQGEKGKERKEQPKKQRILIIEDDLANMIGALSAFNEDKDVEDCLAVGNYQEALVKIEEFKPTLALVDVNIIGGSGRDLANILKEKGIPFVFVTASGNGVEIQSEGGTLAKIGESSDKGPEVWRAAYGFLTGEKPDKGGEEGGE